MSGETIAIAANVALTLSLIVAVVFGVAQVRAASRDRRERLTLETLRAFQTREFAELMQHLVTHEFPRNGPGLRALPREEQVKIIQFAQQMESLGMLVEERFINLDLVDKTLGTLVTNAWEKYRPMFLEMRVTESDPYLGEYFQWLAGRIAERMRNQPREPIHANASRKR